MSIQQRLAQPTRQSASHARFSVKGSICGLRVSNMAARPSHRQTVMSQQQLKPRELISAAVRGGFETDDSRTTPAASEGGNMSAYKPQSPLSASQSSAVVALAVLAGLLAEQPYAPHNPTPPSQSATSREPAPWDGWYDVQEAAPVTPTTAAPTGALPQFPVPVAAAQSLQGAAASAKPAASQHRSPAQPAGPRRPGPPVKPGQYARRLRASNSRATGESDSSSSSVGSWAPVAAAGSVPPVEVQTDTKTRSSSSSNVAGIAAGVVAAGGSAIPTTWNDFQKFNAGKGWSRAVFSQKWREHKALYPTTTSSSSAPAFGSNTQIIAAAGGNSDGAASGEGAGAQSIPRTWNDYQKSMKGRGCTRAMMSQGWREHKLMHGL